MLDHSQKNRELQIEIGTASSSDTGLAATDRAYAPDVAFGDEPMDVGIRQNPHC